MADRSFLEWPFFDDAHRAYKGELERWVAQALPDLLEHDESDLDTVRIIRMIAASGGLEQ